MMYSFRTRFKEHNEYWWGITTNNVTRRVDSIPWIDKRFSEIFFTCSSGPLVEFGELKVLELHDKRTGEPYQLQTVECLIDDHANPGHVIVGDGAALMLMDSDRAMENIAGMVNRFRKTNSITTTITRALRFRGQNSRLHCSKLKSYGKGPGSQWLFWLLVSPSCCIFSHRSWITRDHFIYHSHLFIVHEHHLTKF